MTPVETVLSVLSGVKKAGTGWSARCPAHEDRNPSLSVAAGDDGRALVKCHAGCETPAVVAAMGLRMHDLMPERGVNPSTVNTRPKPGKEFATLADAVKELEKSNGKRSGLWEYHDAAGEVIGAVVRFDRVGGKKLIRPASRHDNCWRIAAMPTPRPLYRLTDLAAAALVVVVEGEKAADAARSIGFAATTSAGGAEAPHLTDWGPLAGKEVIVMPDNDAPGAKYAAAVLTALAAPEPAATVKVVELPGLGDGGDIVDWLAAQSDDCDPDDLRARIEHLAAELAPDVAPPDPHATPTYTPFPVDVLPEPVRGFVTDAAKALGCDPSYLAMPLLTEVAAGIGNTRRLQIKESWYAVPILWTAIVGESGTLKTPAFKLVMKPVRARQNRAFKQYAEALREHKAVHARWEKEMTAWKRCKEDAGEPPPEPEPPTAVRYVVTDTTVEALAPLLQQNPRGLLLACDELAGWFGSFDRYAAKGKAGGDAAKWLSMFNAESFTVDRKTGIPPTIHVPQAALCVTGGIQPGILRRALSDEHRESGLAARLLMTWPPRHAKRWTEADIPPQAEAMLAALFDRIHSLEAVVGEDDELRPVIVRLAPDAKAAFIAYYDAHAAEQVELAGDLAAAWSKLEEYAARLALVIHFVRWASGDLTLKDPATLDAESMTAGIRLTEWFKGETRRIYAMLHESDDDGDDRRLTEWIAQKGGRVTPREVQMGCRWLRDSGAAQAALGELVKRGVGAWETDPKPRSGGHAPTYFRLAGHKPSAPPSPAEPSVDVDTVDTCEAQRRHQAEGKLSDNSGELPD